MDDIDEPRAELSEAQLRSEHGGWWDGNPYYLLIALNDDRFAEIDLGQPGWATTYADFMRAPGKWHLVQKTSQLVSGIVLVSEGDQPYYTAHHVGFTSAIEGGPKGETIVYGIGKKRRDGQVDRLWFFSNGAVGLGEDVDPLGAEMLKRGQL